ncbi:HdeD family acid-resistance protein [Roseisolibacter agri]|nr:DUF308 domain-containing protein [Roseisolibacter agri]
MAEFLVRNWWALAARGGAAILFGAFALLFPGLTLDALVAGFAAFAFADGLLATIAALRPGVRDRRATPRREALLLQGLAGLAMGLVVALWPDPTVFVVVVLLACWALVTGVFAVIAALRLRTRLPEAWWLGAAGLASLAIGLFLGLAELLGVVAIVWWIGVHALVSGALLLVLALRLRARRLAGLATAQVGDARAPRALHEEARGARAS